MEKQLKIAKIFLWYIVGIALLAPYFFIDETRVKQMIGVTDQHSPDWALVLLIFYGVLKYLAPIVGVCMIGVMTVMLVRLYILNKRKN